MEILDATCDAPAMELVDVSLASLGERDVLENLIQLYTHDFSENWAGSDRGDVDDEGRFSSYPLDPYWAAASHVPLLFRRSSRIIGFALLNAIGHTSQPVDRNMAEFFVLRKYRRGGAGTSAAHAIFARFPGVWETAVTRANTTALDFWRHVITSCPGVQAVSEQDMRSSDWDGPVLRFGMPR